MITPSPTTKIDPSLARGVLEATNAATATRSSHVVISFPNTSYRLHLVPLSAIHGEVGKRIIGTIRAQARRVDIVDTGGKYVEPVFGRPRRIQGRVIAADAATNTITVDAGMPIHCELTDERQTAGQFPVGVLVSFDALEGATFTQA